MTRKILFALTLVMAMTVLAGASWATTVEDIKVTGNFFNPRPGSTQLCAEVDPRYSGVEVKFTGETPYEVEFKAKSAFTNAWGVACVKTTWPQGIYEVEAKAFPTNTNGMLQAPKIESESVAVSVFNPTNFCGAQGGGALYLNSYDAGKVVRQTLASRQATFAFIFKKSPVNNFGILYFDNDHPVLGEVEFEARHWFDSNILYFNNPDYASFELIGMGWVETEEYEGPVHYYLYADTFPGFQKFFIALWDPAGNLVYRSAPWNNGVVPELRVFQGQIVVTPCLNGEDWPCQDCP